MIKHGNLVEFCACCFLYSIFHRSRFMIGGDQALSLHTVFVKYILSTSFKTFTL